MERLLIFIFFLILYSSVCSGQNFSPSKQKKTHIFPEKFNLKRTVSEIVAYGRVESAIVGFGGISSEQYGRFIKLKLNASDSELVLLTKNLNSVIKAYAFLALTEKSYSGIKQIIEEHITDRQAFRYQAGCIVETKFINEWYLNLGKRFLTADELANFQKIVSK